MSRINRNRNNQPLTNEQIQKFAPSAFAGQAHDSRSDRYAFVPTSAVIDGMRSNGFDVFFATQSMSRIPGKEYFTKHLLRFRSLVQNVTAVGDTFVELQLTNSHDGTSQYELALAALRLACLNGAVVSEGLAQTLKIRHTGNIIDAVIEGSEKMIALAPRVVEAIQTWKLIELNTDEQRILAESALSLRFDGQAPVDAASLLTVNRYQDRTNDLWTVFNRIQENVIRGGLRYQQRQNNPETGEFVRMRNSRTREVKGIDQNTKLNQELWTLAEKMAALKSGK